MKRAPALVPTLAAGLGFAPLAVPSRGLWGSQWLRGARFALSAVILLIATAVVQLPRSSARADAVPSAEPIVTQLPLTGFSEMVVDDAHSLVFLSGMSSLDASYGASDSTVVAITFDGTIAKTFAGLPGAAGLYLDGSANVLYVAESDGDAIQAIATDTLSLGKTWDLGSDAGCPTDVAPAGGLLWATVLCGPNHPGLASLDPSTSAVHVFPVGTYVSLLDPDPGDANALFAAELYSSPSGAVKYDTSSGSPVQTATGGGGSGLADVAVFPDGSDVITAAAAPYYLDALHTSDMTPDIQYETGAYPSSVAVSPDSKWVAGGNGGAQLFQAGVGSPAFNVFPDAETGAVWARGLAMSADDGRLFVVSGNEQGPVLRILAHPTVPVSTLTLAPASQVLPIRDTALIKGTLSFSQGGPLGGKTIHITRSGPNATQVVLPDVTTDASGAFAITDVPPLLGTFTYEATYSGTANHRQTFAFATVNTVMRKTYLHLSVSHTRVVYGKTVHVTAHLKEHDPGEVVSIYITRYGGAQQVLKTGAVSASGDLSASFVARRKTTLVAHTDGTEIYRDATTPKRVVQVTPLLRGGMVGGYATRDGYRLYHFSTGCPKHGKGCPISVFKLTPNHAGKKLYVLLEVYDKGWHRVADASGLLSKKSMYGVRWVYGSRDIVGIRARVRAYFGGDADYTNVTSAWLYFIVTN